MDDPFQKIKQASSQSALNASDTPDLITGKETEHAEGAKKARNPSQRAEHLEAQYIENLKSQITQKDTEIEKLKGFPEENATLNERIRTLESQDTFQKVLNIISAICFVVCGILTDYWRWIFVAVGVVCTFTSACSGHFPGKLATKKTVTERKND